MVRENTKHFKFVDEDKILQMIEEELQACADNPLEIMEWTLGYRSAMIRIKQRIINGTLCWQPGSE